MHNCFMQQEVGQKGWQNLYLESEVATYLGELEQCWVYT